MVLAMLVRSGVAYVLKDSPAECAGLKRGAQLVNVLAATYLSWYRLLTGASVTFTVRDTPTSAELRNGYPAVTRTPCQRSSHRQR